MFHMSSYLKDITTSKLWCSKLTTQERLDIRGFMDFGLYLTSLSVLSGLKHLQLTGEPLSLPRLVLVDPSLSLARFSRQKSKPQTRVVLLTIVPGTLAWEQLCRAHQRAVEACAR